SPDHPAAFTTFITGSRDVLGGGITGCGPVSAETGMRAGTPHDVATRAVAANKRTQGRFLGITILPRKNHANTRRMISLKPCRGWKGGSSAPSGAWCWARGNLGRPMINGHQRTPVRG